jgi:competence protein ComEA
MEVFHMKRTVLSLGAAALVLAVGTAAFADDAPATPPATTPATTPATSTPAPASETKPMHHSAHHKGAKSMAVNLNTATKEQLMTLPGIDDATADKIIAARPFAMRSELVKKSIVTKAEYAKIRSKISAKKA